MNYMNLKKVSSVAGLALILGLGACGSNDGVPVQPLPPPVQPPINNQNFDFEGMMVQQLQMTYGNIILESAVSAAGITIAAGNYSWAEMNARVKEIAIACACNSGQPMSGASIWININYNQFSNFAGAFVSQSGPASNALVHFVNYPNYIVTFADVFNTLVSINYTYYSSYYYYYYGNYMPTQWNNGTTVGGSFNYSNGNFNFNLGGLFNF